MDFSRARAELGKQLKSDRALQHKLGVPDNFLQKNGDVNGAVIERWMKERQLVWHHFQDMQTMQLVQHPIHYAARHTGGQAFAQSVTRELIKRNIMDSKRAGLTPELIMKARELGIIPADFLP